MENQLHSIKQLSNLHIFLKNIQISLLATIKAKVKTQLLYKKTANYQTKMKCNHFTKKFRNNLICS